MLERKPRRELQGMGGALSALAALPLMAGAWGCGGGSEDRSDSVPHVEVPTVTLAPQEPMTEEPAVEASPVAMDAPANEALDESTPLDEAVNMDDARGEGPAAQEPAEDPLGEAASSGWPVPVLEWAPCDNGFECADALVPRDYAEPDGATYRVRVTRRPARNAASRIGALFFNFGGPGGGAISALQGTANGRFAALNERFDLVALDPRGTGASEAVIDCGVNQEAEGLYSQPFFTPENLDIEAWMARAQRYVDACVESDDGVIGIAATANVARDLDRVRAALGDERLSYLGYSYGTFLGATFAALFPSRYRALVLDAPVDPDQYINRPTEGLWAQTAAMEAALSRFFEACAADPVACRGFGGDDPALAYDRLVAELTLEPLAVPGSGRPLDADDVLFATVLMLYDKGSWNTLAAALAALAGGNGAPLRQLADSVYGRNEDGSYDPAGDGYFVLSATEQTYASDAQLFLDGGELSAAEFEHFYSNVGYSELPYGLFPIHSSGAFRGPFVASAGAPPILVVGTRFDPATPYAGAISLVEQLGNARLLTMQGDGHGAYGGNSACIDASVDAYLLEGTLPELGAECVQQVPFGIPQNAAFIDAAAAPAAAVDPGLTARPSRVLYRGRWLTL
jgi:pimeloyl-ACP methyl ester carboxylesterase